MLFGEMRSAACGQHANHGAQLQAMTMALHVSGKTYPATNGPVTEQRKRRSNAAAKGRRARTASNVISSGNGPSSTKHGMSRKSRPFLSCIDRESVYRTEDPVHGGHMPAQLWRFGNMAIWPLLNVASATNCLLAKRSSHSRRCPFLAVIVSVFGAVSNLKHIVTCFVSMDAEKLCHSALVCGIINTRFTIQSCVCFAALKPNYVLMEMINAHDSVESTKPSSTPVCSDCQAPSFGNLLPRLRRPLLSWLL